MQSGLTRRGRITRPGILFINSHFRSVKSLDAARPLAFAREQATHWLNYARQESLLSSNIY
jgi:hypothetical protein